MGAKVGIIGAGRWGTTLAILLSRAGHDVMICVLPSELEQLKTRRRSANLPRYQIPSSVSLTTSPLDLRGFHFAIFAVPGENLKKAWEFWSPGIEFGNIVVSAVKTIDEDSGRLVLPSDIMVSENPFVYLACAAFPEGVLRGKATIGTAYSLSEVAAEEVQALIFSTGIIRPYTSLDIIGGQIGSAAKNVIAIACGMAIDLGDEMTNSAICNRGAAEIARFALRYGGKESTFKTGGTVSTDLGGTCRGPNSRNYLFGSLFVREPKKIAKIRGVVEGLRTVEVERRVSSNFERLMPISAAVYAIIHHQLTPKEAGRQLMQRPLKAEI